MVGLDIRKPRLAELFEIDNHHNGITNLIVHDAIKREMNNAKWFWFAIGYQCGLAYVVSLCIYQIGTLITTGAFGIGTVVAFLLVIGFLYLLFRPYKESNSLNVNTKKVVSAK